MIDQLRIYKIEPSLKQQFDDRFKIHASRIMHKYGFDIREMWHSEVDGEMEFIYILRWTDIPTMKKGWERFMADEEWNEIKAKSRVEHGEMVLGKVRDQVLHKVEWSLTAKG